MLGATAALSALGALSVFIALVAGVGQGSLGIPLGLPSGTILLVLDPLSGFFLLLLFVTATACAVFAMDAHGAEDLRSTPFFPVFIAGDGADVAGRGRLWRSSSGSS